MELMRKYLITNILTIVEIWKKKYKILFIVYNKRQKSISIRTSAEVKLKEYHQTKQNLMCMKKMWMEHIFKLSPPSPDRLISCLPLMLHNGKLLKLCHGRTFIIVLKVLDMKKKYKFFMLSSYLYAGMLKQVIKFQTRAKETCLINRFQVQRMLNFGK